MKNCLTNLNDNKLADILTFVKALDQIKVVSRLYDGTYNVQTIGTPASFAEVNVQAVTAQMDLINEAEASGEILQIEYKDNTYTGQIESAVKWDAVVKGKVYSGTFKFLITG